MSRIAIVHPVGLLARELREQLHQRPDLCSDLQLLTTHDEEVGVLTEVSGGAGLVARLDSDALSGIDLVFVCGDDDTIGTAIGAIPEGIPTVIVQATGTGEHGTLRIAGAAEPPTTRTLCSPHAAVVALSHLLASLSPLAPRQTVATVIVPASVREQAGLDELFAQTNAILNFTGERSEEVFGHQLAFNLLPVEGAEEIAAQLSGVPEAPEVSLQLLQGGVFHSLSISLWVAFDTDPGIDEIRDRLAEHRSIELAEEVSTLGPIDGATTTRMLVGTVTPGAPNSYWLWAVADNLTHGGALNAIELATELLSGRTSS